MRNLTLSIGGMLNSKGLPQKTIYLGKDTNRAFSKLIELWLWGIWIAPLDWWLE